MTDTIAKLLLICSNDIAKPLKDGFDLSPIGSLSEYPEYISLMRRRNGFYGFESALHVFPLISESEEIDAISWNDKKLWSENYEGLTDSHFFFAEDAFGGQFSLNNQGIFTFDPETGESLKLCDTLLQWSEAILNDFNFLTGYSLAHEWQAVYGKIPAGQRLVPKTPFILGGDFSLENLHLQSSVAAMRYRASIAIQISGLPDGRTVKISVDDEHCFDG